MSPAIPGDPAQSSQDLNHFLKALDLWETLSKIFSLDMSLKLFSHNTVTVYQHSPPIATSPTQITDLQSF